MRQVHAPTNTIRVLSFGVTLGSSGIEANRTTNDDSGTFWAGFDVHRTRRFVFLWIVALLLGPQIQARGHASPQTAGAEGGNSASQISNANNLWLISTRYSPKTTFHRRCTAFPVKKTQNTRNLRPVIVAGRHIVRATLPVQATRVGEGQ